MKRKFIEIERPEHPSKERLKVRTFDGNGWKPIGYADHKPYTKGRNGIEIGEIRWIDLSVDVHPAVENAFQEGLPVGANISETEESINKELGKLKDSVNQVASYWVEEK